MSLQLATVGWDPESSIAHTLPKTARGGVKVNYNGGTSNVVVADVKASNGVIHVIDKVIL